MSAVTGIFWFCLILFLFFFCCYPLGNGSVAILIIPTERKKKEIPNHFLHVTPRYCFLFKLFLLSWMWFLCYSRAVDLRIWRRWYQGKPSSSLLSTLLIGQRLKACFKICVCDGRSRKKNWVWLKVRRFSKTQLYILSHQKQGIQFIKHNCFQTLLE